MPNSHSAHSVLSDIAASAADAIRKGTRDASGAAERTIPAVKQSVSKGTYLVCYGLSFGAVYAAEVLMELLPDDSVIRYGFRDGASAAKDTRRQHREGDEATVPNPTPNPTPAL